MRSTLTVITLLSVLTALPAHAGIEAPAPEVVVSDAVAVVSPAGTLASLEAQGLTIRVRVFGSNAEPISGFPADQISLQPVSTPEPMFCAGEWSADSDTDASGYTSFNRAIAAGGFSPGEFAAYASGGGFSEPFTLRVISPDYDGNLTVDTLDFGKFGEDFRGSPLPRSDFVPDGVIDLGDFVIFAEHFGESCP